MTKHKSGDTAYIVQFKSGGMHTFGSIAAIFDMFDAISLGVSRSRIYGYVLEVDKPYSNKICIISKCFIHRKPGNRTNSAGVKK